MDPIYRIANIDEIPTPALVFYPELIRSNLAEVIRLAGSAARLCPHVKTHKTREIARLQLEMGITSHKCATIVEAEMLAQVGVPDVLIAYPMVGPNVGRLRSLADIFPQTNFSCLVDHPDGMRGLERGWAGRDRKLDVMIDLNVGQDRTGIPIGPDAFELYRSLAASEQLRPVGFHVYDGHNSADSLAAREEAVQALLAPVLQMRKSLESQGFAVPRILCGGTPSFPVWAGLDIPGMQCSPGTFILYDQGYGSKYAELAGLKPAALVITRVVSKPLPRRVTFDLGHKAIAADPPAGKRCILLNLTEFTPAIQNEEHFAVDTPDADRWRIGDVAYAVPAHVCPTVALHRTALIVEGNRVVGEWEIAARNRVLTV
jgi:D-threonine aldolase